MPSKKETRNKTRRKGNILAGLRKNDLGKGGSAGISNERQNLANILASLAMAVFYGVKFLNEKTKTDSKNFRSTGRKNIRVSSKSTSKTFTKASRNSKKKRLSSREDEEISIIKKIRKHIKG